MKKKVAIIFGGCSSEYMVSLASASSVIKNLNKDKYDYLMIGITENGEFYLYDGDVNKIETNQWIKEKLKKVTISVNRSDHGIIVIDTGEVIKIDIAFPVLHGRNGEDGRLQGLLELAGIKYVGCDMTSSALCMDKYLAHKMVYANGILCPKSYLFKKEDNYDDIKKKIKQLKYPIFIKPLRAGSSFGISKINNINNLNCVINEAFKYDDKIIIEESVDGFEVGCAILGNNDLKIGEVDEIELQTSFFDYFEKYNLKTSKIYLPARVSKEEREKIQKTALDIYKILGCTGFARVDMFYTKDKKIIFNEVNTIPGFTTHSRYPSMFKKTGISFEEIIDEIIELGLER